MATNNNKFTQKDTVVSVKGISPSSITFKLADKHYKQTEDAKMYDKLQAIAEKLPSSDIITVSLVRGEKVNIVSTSTTSIKLDNVIKSGATSLGYIVHISVSQVDVNRVARELAKLCRVEDDENTFHYELDGKVVTAEDIQQSAKNKLSNTIDRTISVIEKALRSNADLMGLPAIKYLKEYPEATELSKQVEAIAFDVDGNVRPEVKVIFSASKDLGSLPDVSTMKALLAKAQKAKS